MRIRSLIIGSIAAVSLIATASAARLPSENTKSAVAFIALYDSDGKFTGWGTGFFVDEGIVITNKHVIEGGYYYRVYATGEDGKVNLTCYRTLGRTGVKINRDDDVAYVRSYVDCPHGAVYFASADPKPGDAIGILGYPSRGKLSESIVLSHSTGSVTGKDADGPWMTTDAYLDYGNSGGPVVKDDRVVGVAVAKEVTSGGTYLAGLFVPVSQILAGLENANDPSFGYTPQFLQNNPAYTQTFNGPATDDDCRVMLGDGGMAADSGGCKCGNGYKKDATGTMCVWAGGSRSSSSSSVSSASSVSSSSSASSVSSVRSASSSSSAQNVSGFEARTCERVLKWFRGNRKMLDRVNVRLQKRFNFLCRA